MPFVGLGIENLKGGALISLTTVLCGHMWHGQGPDCPLAEVRVWTIRNAPAVLRILTPSRMVPLTPASGKELAGLG